VGFAVCCILPNSPVYRARWIGYINDLCVTERMRGRGIGEFLVRDSVKWLKDSGADSIEVYVAHKNDGAQRFWRRVGGRDYLDRMSIDTASE
jgi:ribosomal protein S18 acetylase RimI-like enzyme